MAVILADGRVEVDSRPLESLSRDELIELAEITINQINVMQVMAEMCMQPKELVN